ncbi:MAG: hypothetical protein HY533_05300 [Chloroflexi bacterium]|nr:hypothetical protein [Chloroflexota bacterium]
MRLYEISAQQVADIITTPDLRELSAKGRVNATKALAGRRVRVTYIEEEQGYVIITVTPLDDP